jgi:hypothetical protein
MTTQDKRVYTKLQSAQPESSVGLGLIKDGVSEQSSSRKNGV